MRSNPTRQGFSVPWLSWNSLLETSCSHTEISLPLPPRLKACTTTTPGDWIIIFINLIYLLYIPVIASLSSVLTILPFLLPSFSSEKKGALPWMSTHLGISSSRRTRHILGDQIINVSINLSFRSNLLGSNFFSKLSEETQTFNRTNLWDMFHNLNHNNNNMYTFKNVKLYFNFRE